MAGVPRGPVEEPPRGFVPQAEQARILAGVLAGIELGAWDRRIVEWLAVRYLLREGEPLTVAVDGTFFRRCLFR